MGSEVYTKATCDVCGAVFIFKGAEGGFPPVGWYQLTLSKRLAGVGWINSDRTEKMLCGGCAKKVLLVLECANSAEVVNG